MKKPKKPYDEKIISIMSFAIFALLLAEAYFNHKEDIDESVARLKSVLNDSGNKQISEGDTDNAE